MNLSCFHFSSFFSIFFLILSFVLLNRLSLTLCFAHSQCPHEYVKDLKWHDEALLVGYIVDFDERM
jgi:hypothetical protein